MKNMELRVAITVTLPEGDESAVGDILRRYFDDQAENIEKTITRVSASASLEKVVTIYKQEGVLAPFKLQKAGWV